jgi:hypothetical protein
MQAERCTDADHSTRGLIRAGLARGFISEGVEPRERQRDARGLDESATADIHDCMLVAKDYLL